MSNFNHKPTRSFEKKVTLPLHLWHSNLLTTVLSFVATASFDPGNPIPVASLKNYVAEGSTINY